jgi:hypothetical protein
MNRARCTGAEFSGFRYCWQAPIDFAHSFLGPTTQPVEYGRGPDCPP